VPYPVKGLGDVKKHSVAVFLLFQTHGDFIKYSMNLMNGIVAFAEAKIYETEGVLKDHVLRLFFFGVIVQTACW
jgi:hypothetical protein